MLANGRRKSAQWAGADLRALVLYSRQDRSQKLEAHIEDVIEQLAANKRCFVDISSTYGGHLQLVGYFHSYYPGLSLDRTILASLAEYALSVDFDFYYLYSDRREDS